MEELNPHAFHLNLPKHHIDDDNVPYITKFAEKKSRDILRLAHSIQLNEALFYRQDTSTDDDDDDMDDAVDDDEEEASSEDHSLPKDYTMASVSKKCTRLVSQLSSLEGTKHSGITQLEMCKLVLHLLKLVCATVSIEEPPEVGESAMDIDGAQPTKKVTLHYENVGYVYGDEDESVWEKSADSTQLEEELNRPFALPTPARDALMSVLLSILSKKSLLRSASNAALFPTEEEKQTRLVLVIHWRALFRVLVRTAPFLDEHKWAPPATDSNTRHNSVVKKTVQVIRCCRRFYDQGIGPSRNATLDKTAKEVWELVKPDLLYRRHTHAFYRALIIIYLFQPTRCSSAFYLEVMPHWVECWTALDRYTGIDYLWMVLFCRARKHLSPEDFDWGFIRRRLLTLSQYWLQIPVGGASMDPSFPRAGVPRNRACPSRLKTLLGSGSSYEEGMDFVAKVAKLLVSNIGSNEPGRDSEGDEMSQGTADILRLLSFLTPYFNPSNVGRWTFTLGAFLHNFSYELCRRIGTCASLRAMRASQPAALDPLFESEPWLKRIDIAPRELVALLDVLLQLSQQSIYSKNSHVGRAGEAALVYLAQVDPVHVIPKFLDFAISALDISAVNLSHQAPAALSAMTRLLQPSLRHKPSLLLSRLPQILNLSLAGIDSNDRNKTLQTLVFYTNLASWVPVGVISPTTNSDGVAETPGANGTMVVGPSLLESLREIADGDGYRESIAALPETSLISQESDNSNDSYIYDEASSAMTDWVLGFLDRVYELLRSAGEREKSGKTGSGVASRHSSSDYHKAKAVSRILKECLMQVFAAMDGPTLQHAIRSVTKFLSEESLPSAAKDAAALCQALCSLRATTVDGVETLQSPGLEALIPVLTDDLENSSNKTLIYRLRCLAGAVRTGGRVVFEHRQKIHKALLVALSSTDKHVYKTGCKLLRHTLSSQCESYPVLTARAPNRGGNHELGKGAQLLNDNVRWYTPCGAQLDFVGQVLFEDVVSPLFQMEEAKEARNGSLAFDNQQLRRQLRALRYALRGCSGILIERVPGDGEEGGSLDVSLLPHERAVHCLLSLATEDTRMKLGTLRKQICGYVACMSSIVGSETVDSEVSDESVGLLSSDTKICKELCEISLLLLTRRGSSFRYQEMKMLWKAQKQLVSDYPLSSEANHMLSVMERCGLAKPTEQVLYKDGEDGGKITPRRLIVTRIRLFYESLQRSASFEIPRVLRRQQLNRKESTVKLYSAQMSAAQAMEKLKSNFNNPEFSGLDAYEGLLDGLFALTCHSNTEVRASAIGVVDYSLTRFGWFVRSRVPRLLSALTLKDEDVNGKYGIPSCALLSQQVDSQGKRRRLGEVLKGVCSILALSRSTREMLSSEKSRLLFVQRLCEAEKVISLLPTEEMQKMVHYFQSVFSPFRSKYFVSARATKAQQATHEATLDYLISTLADKGTNGDGSKDSPSAPAHWRRRLLVMWFLLTLIDPEDCRSAHNGLWQRTWDLCLNLLESEMGQPMQRLALGLFGRLVSFKEVLPPGHYAQLKHKLTEESFCALIGKALAFDHKEDTSFGGGHDVQWSTGIEDLIRDASRNVAPRSMYPFMRTGQSSRVFKLNHAQLVDTLIRLGEKESILQIAQNMLNFASVLSASPPSEDQRNQLVTAAEIFGGVCQGILQGGDEEVISKYWDELAIPFLREVIVKIPMSITGAYSDAFRYGLQFASPEHKHKLSVFVIDNIEALMGEGKNVVAENGINADVKRTAGVDGFTQQSKWLYFASSMIIELTSAGPSRPWFSGCLSTTPRPVGGHVLEIQKTWALLITKFVPLLLSSLGHPYDSCRDHIAGCLFRMHTCSGIIAAAHRETGAENEFVDPTSLIVNHLANIVSSQQTPSTEYYNSLITARKFISYCVHLGNAKEDYHSCIVQLLPTAFASLKSAPDGSEDEQGESDAAIRALQAEVFKGYRGSIAEMSVACLISYETTGIADIMTVLELAQTLKGDTTWQVRQALAHFLRCFQDSHKFLFSTQQADSTLKTVAKMLSDDRAEVSAAAMSTLTGILAATQSDTVTRLVASYAKLANRSKIKKKKANQSAEKIVNGSDKASVDEKEKQRARNQQTAVFFLCAAILAQPYDTPTYVPVALASISKHSYKSTAPRGVREIVKKCCGEYKRTHMSDNWEIHRKVFTQEQLEALEDVVSTPHYFA